MKTGERQSSSGSEEGSFPRDDRDFVDVESESADDCQSQYEEYDVNKFLDNVLMGIWGGRNEDDYDHRIKRLGKALRKACQERDLVQLVRGVLHLVELYQAGKRERSRKAAGGNGGKRTAPLKNSNKGTRPSKHAVGERRRRHEDDGVVPQGGNKNILADIINLEENAGTPEADWSGSNQGPDESEVLQDLESSTVKRENEFPQNEEEELPSEVEGQEENNINDDWVPPTVTHVASLYLYMDEANAFEEEEEKADEKSSSSVRLPRPKRMPVLIPEVPQDPSRLDSYIREKVGALERKRGLLKPSQKKTSDIPGGEYSSSSCEIGFSLQEEDSLSESFSRNDQEEAAMKGPLKRQKRGLQMKKNLLKDVPNMEEEDCSSRSESDDSLQDDDFLSPAPTSDASSGNDQEEEKRPLKRRKKRLQKPPQKKMKAFKDTKEATSGKKDVSPQKERSTRKGPKRTHKCPICMKMWPSKSDLARHSMVHTGEKPFKCPSPGCGRAFNQKALLANHRWVHDGKPFKCSYPGCKKAFTTPTSLEAHKRVHTGVMPFKCKFPGCCKEFAFKSSLKNHEGVHTRPFKCPFQGCGQAFGTKGHLQYHQKTKNHY